MNQTVKLTEDVIEKAKAPEKGSYFLWDEGTRGGSFGVRVFAGGMKTYVVRYRLGSGRGALERLRKLEPVGKGRLKAVRALAGDVLLAARRGEDILAEHHRAATEETLAGYGAAWLAGRIKDGEITGKTVKLYTFVFEKRLVPALGTKLVRDIGERDVRAFKRKHSEAKTVANKGVNLLKQILETAERDGLRERHSNPCTPDMLYEETKSAGIYLTGPEMDRLATALQNLPPKAQERRLLEFLLLLAFTSCRPVEIATLRLEQYDRDRGVLVLQRTRRSKRTKTNKPRLVALNSVAKTLVDRMVEGKVEGLLCEEWGQDYDAWQNYYEKTWRLIRESAKLPDGVRVYDLRHNFPSWGMMLGENLSIVQHLQGHENIGTTEKYIHLAVGPVREASERVAGKLVEHLGAALPVN